MWLDATRLPTPLLHEDNTLRDDDDRMALAARMLVALPAAEVATLLGISRAQVWAMVRRGELPKPTYLSQRCPRWHADTLYDWIFDGKNGRETST